MRLFRSFTLCIFRLYVYTLLSAAQQDAPSTHQRHNNCTLRLTVLLYTPQLHLCTASDIHSLRAGTVWRVATDIKT